MRETSMGFTYPGAGLYRVLAFPAARLAFMCTAGVVAVGLFAGAVRLSPLFLGQGLPLRVLGPLARAALAVSLETGLFVAPSLAWALAGAALLDRGEARALFAVGVRPARLALTAWPSLLLLAILAAFASLTWGTEAAAPGRLARALLTDVRSACAAAVTDQGGPSAPPVAYDVPSLGLSWVCFPGEEPRLIGPAPFGVGPAVLSARDVTLSDDLRSIELRDASLAFSPHGSGALAGAQIHVGQAFIAGIAPLGRASNLSVAARTTLMACSSALFASLAALVILHLGVRSRGLAAAIGVSGPASALMLFSTLERAPAPPLAYLLVPLLGTLTLGAASLAIRLIARHTAS